MASADCNDIEMRHENSCSRCECNACADPKRFRPQLASCSGAYSCAPVSPDWDYMVSGVPNRTKEGETRIVTEVMTVFTLNVEGIKVLKCLNCLVQIRL